jgi:uncharacterized membrane protein
VSQNTAKPDPLKFRLSFIALPLAVLLLTIALSAIFYSQLPDEVNYRFDLNGEPSGSPLAKASLVTLMVGIQALLTAIAYIATSSIGRAQLFRDNVENFWFNPTRLLTLMGNMPAIIQVIMAYVLVDAIVYALQANHLMPLWLFAVITLVIGGIIVLVYGLPIVIKGYKGLTSIQEKKKE